MTQVGRVAVIGVGYWGKNIARSFADLGVLGGIVDSHAETAEAVSKLTGAPIRLLDDVLADPNIEGIAIATRAETHFRLAQQALSAGKHVFIEKPLVLDQGEAEALIKQARDCAKTLMVGHLLRYHPLFRKMVEIVQSGEWGAVRHITSDRMSLGKIRTEEDVLWSFAPHDVSMILALAGEEPETVSAQGTSFINAGIADYATAQLGFASGLRADVRVSWLSYKKIQKCVAICDKATIVFEDSEAEWEKKLVIHPHDVMIENGLPVPKRGTPSYPNVLPAEPLKEECQHFLDCVAGAAPLTDGKEGLAVLRILQRAKAAMAAATGGVYVHG
jgi:predicted dehydrogenase